MNLKRRLRDFGIAALATITLAGCATNYYERYSQYRDIAQSYETSVLNEDTRTGFEIIPKSFDFFGDVFKIEGNFLNGQKISIYENLNDSNYNLLVNVAADLTKIIELNEDSPAGHPQKGVYVTGKYNHQIGKEQILELETVNMNGNLYYTDPTNNSGLAINVGFEFWNQNWWRNYNKVYYPLGLKPWWDPSQTGIILNYHSGIFQPNGDWDGDGISNWAEECIGTNPYNRDSDYDGLEDLTELWFGTNPLDRDSDNDGYWDGEDPFPLWHSRHHENYHYRDWHLWWNHHYNDMNRRHQPLHKQDIPGETWRTKTDRSTERIQYKQRLNTQEESIRRKVEGGVYTPNNPRERQENSNRVYQPRTKKIRKIPEVHAPERKIIQSNRKIFRSGACTSGITCT